MLGLKQVTQPDREWVVRPTRRYVVLALLVAGMFLSFSASSALADGPNLLTNGSFDLGTLAQGDPGGAPTGWHTEDRFGQGGGVDLVSGSADTGTYWVDLDGTPSQGSIYQDVPTTAGHTYHITLAMSGNSSCELGQKQMQVRWNGSTVASPTYDTSAGTGWVHLGYSVAAGSGATTRLEFSSLTSGTCGPAVDSVSVADQTSGQTWDLTHDFPVSGDGTTPPANPAPDSYGNSGVWGIGWGVSSYTHGPAMASFRLAPSTDWEAAVPAGQTAAQGWADTQPDQNHGGPIPYYPYLGKNTSGGDAFGGGGVWPNGVVEGHPADDTNAEDRAAAEWISPITGTVSIAASLTSVNNCSPGLDYSVDVQPNGGSLAHLAGGYFPSGGAATYDNSSVSVHAGDRYFFSVGDGHNNDYTCDSTQFSIVISSAAGGTGGSLAWENDITGDGTQALNHPEGVSLNTANHPVSVVIADSGNNRLEYANPLGTSLTTFDGSASNDGFSLSDPRQAIWNNGQFIISDTNDGQVKTITESGNTDNGTFGTTNGGPVNYGFPRGIAQNGDGSEVAVADAGSSAVFVFDSSGNQLLRLTGVGSSFGALKNPEGVAFDGAGNLWVADTQNHRLVEFSAAGSVVKTISPSSSFYPTGISIDPFSGNIWVAAWGNNDVVELSPSGSVLQTITRARGTGDSLNGPVTLAFDPSSGDLYVADTSNNRIVHYTGAGQAPVVTTDGIFSSSSTDIGVQGTVNPEGRSTTYYVQYGTSSDPSSLTQYQPAAPQSLADGSNNPYTDTTGHTVQVHLSGLTSGQNYCYRFVAFNAMGPANGDIKCRNTVAPPTVTTDGVISTSSTDLNIKGTINPQGTPSLKYYFQLGVDQNHMTSYKPLPPPGQSLGFSDSSNHDFTADFGGLTAGTNYCFQIVATNGSSTYKGGVICHSTTGVPTVSTDGFFSQSTDDIGIQGTITPNGTPNLKYYIAYGKSSSNLNAFYPSTSGTALGYSDFSPHTVQVHVPHLQAGTQYCFQLVATNGPGTWKGDVFCHATTGSPVPLITTSTAACSRTRCDWDQTTAHLTGTVNPDGTPTSWYFQISRCPGLDYSKCPSAFQNTTAVPGTPVTLSSTDYSPNIVGTTVTNLQPGTTYYYRLVATNKSTGKSTYGCGPASTDPQLCQNDGPNNDGIQSITTSQLLISAQYFDGQGRAHQFAVGTTPTFDPSSGLAWSFSCSLLGQVGDITSCDAHYTDSKGTTGWHSSPGSGSPLGAACTGSSKCDYTITINALDSYGQTAQAVYHYSVNPPPPPVVQHKSNANANKSIGGQTDPGKNCGILGAVCGAVIKGIDWVGGGLVAAGNFVSQKVKAATRAAQQFLQGFGANLASLAQSAKDFLGALFTKMTFTIGGHTSPVPFCFGFDQDGNRFIASCTGYHLEPGTVGNIIGAGGGNIIGAGGGNARDVASDGRSASQSNGSQAYLAQDGEPVKEIAVSNQTGKLAGIIGAGAGNLNIFAQIIGAGGGNFAAGLCAIFSDWFNSHIIGAGGGNIIGAGGGNIIGAGAGNFKATSVPKIIGAGAGNLGGNAKVDIIGAGGGNIIGAGAGNATDLPGMAQDAASGGAFYGASPLTFTELAGTIVTSKVLIVPLKRGRPQGKPVVLGSGSTTFSVTGKGTLWITYTGPGGRLLLAVGAHNAVAAKKHRALEKLRYTVTNTFKPLKGKATTYTHSYTSSPRSG